MQGLVREAQTIFDRNTVGPRRYISLYEKYSGLLSGEADRDKDRFLASTPPLKGPEKKFAFKKFLKLLPRQILNLFIQYL